MRGSGAWIVLPLVGCLLCPPVFPQTTQRTSVATGGGQGNDESEGPSLSPEGRYMAFWSSASNLVPGDRNGRKDIFIHDLQTGGTERVSVATGGSEANGDSVQRSISPDVRHVAFTSNATNLVPSDTNGSYDVFVRDRKLGTTILISLSTGGELANDFSEEPSISADGRYVAFRSRASNLVPGDTNGIFDIYVRDIENNTTELISVATNKMGGNADSQKPSISADGRYVAFWSHASDLIPGDANLDSDVFLRDRQLGTTVLVSLALGGGQGNNSSYSPSMSPDGRYLAFVSTASNLVPIDTNSAPDVFVRDRQAGTTELISLASDGTQGNDLCERPAISPDGRFVGFYSEASNLVPGDTNGFDDAFVRDRLAGTTEIVSLSTSGAQGNGPCSSHSVSISAYGRHVAFESKADNLVPDDTNGDWDTFVRDRQSSDFASLCDPGLDNVMLCPCSNPPMGTDRGCNNSSSTGGASLSATGLADLGMDSLILTTGGERATALSIVMQGNGSIPTGVTYGQGVRCVGGTIIRRLFIKTAVAGSIIAPDFAAGDPSISARSAAKGDVIEPGQSRWYLVYYRDGVVLGGCSVASKFNATQTGQVAWLP